MTITIGSFSTNALTAQPYGYEGDARAGLTARTFRVSGLLTSSQWQALRTVYDTWRNTRITDEDTAKSLTVGTTVSLTSTSTNGISVTSLACWFIEPPSGEQVGPYISADVRLVDAAQALEVLIRQQEKGKQASDADTPDVGTLTLGTVVIKLTRPLETRVDTPAVALTAGGTSYVSGALKAHKARQVQGFITTGTYDDLLAWYDTSITSVPAVSAWFPTAPPQATAEVVIAAGVKTTRYNVELALVQIL